MRAFRPARKADLIAHIRRSSDGLCGDSSLEGHIRSFSGLRGDRHRHSDRVHSRSITRAADERPTTVVRDAQTRVESSRCSAPRRRCAKPTGQDGRRHGAHRLREDVNTRAVSHSTSQRSRCRPPPRSTAGVRRFPPRHRSPEGRPTPWATLQSRTAERVEIPSPRSHR